MAVVSSDLSYATLFILLPLGYYLDKCIQTLLESHHTVCTALFRIKLATVITFYDLHENYTLSIHTCRSVLYVNYIHTNTNQVKSSLSNSSH